MILSTVPAGDHVPPRSTGRALFAHIGQGGARIIDVALATALDVPERA
ncbi:MAG: hypothetical protein HYR88_10910 [Verrucomicrobia bacterium]|nr:hypothetical protein [Verrucomicrobiota bacterium]MBI3869039.1 hypothetical protein [Verrucomicrobiota bacterium]